MSHDIRSCIRDESQERNVTSGLLVAAIHHIRQKSAYSSSRDPLLELGFIAVLV